MFIVCWWSVDKSGVANVEGIYTLFQKDPQDFVNFKNKYVTKFGVEPSSYSMYAYDGTFAISKALKNSKNVDEVKQKLLGLSNSATKLGSNAFLPHSVDNNSRYRKLLNNRLLPH